jgi:hypothetical protein
MTLTEYIPAFLGNIYDYLGWSGSTVNFIISDVLESLQLNSESDSTDIKSLHAVARIKSLEKALTDLSIDYTYSADGSSYHRSDVYNQVLGLLETAYSDYQNGNGINLATFDKVDDPYNPASYASWWS